MYKYAFLVLAIFLFLSLVIPQFSIIVILLVLYAAAKEGQL